MPRLIWSALAIGLSALAAPAVEITGDFGRVAAPTQSQIAVVGLKDGDSVLARRLHQEDDTVYTLLLDYGSRSVPEDSIAWIRIRARNPSEVAEPDHTAVKEFAKDAAGATALHWLPYLLVAIPGLLLMWFLSRIEKEL